MKKDVLTTHEARAVFAAGRTALGPSRSSYRHRWEGRPRCSSGRTLFCPLQSSTAEAEAPAADSVCSVGDRSCSEERSPGCYHASVRAWVVALKAVIGWRPMNSTIESVGLTPRPVPTWS